MPTSDWEYWDEEIDAWNRLHFVAATCTSRDRAKRLTATQVVLEWNKSGFEHSAKEQEASSLVAPATDGIADAGGEVAPSAPPEAQVAATGM